MERLGSRKGELKNMISDEKGRIRMDYVIPARALIGFHTDFLTMTSGTGIAHHVFSHYGLAAKGEIPHRLNGVLISNQAGVALGFSLWNLQERGRMLIGPQTEVYEGMVVGIHTRDNDLVVNVCKAKQLTNMRASGSDENIMLTPPILMTLEQALEFIDDDELVEVTPSMVRVRKKYLKEHERKRK
jgi:GTP-binding protein